MKLPTLKDIRDVFGVLFYVILYLIMTLLYCTPRILAECTFYDPSKLPIDFNFPLEIYSWGLLAICGYYSGIDFGLPTKFKLKTKLQKEVKATNVLLVAISLLLVLSESVFFCIKFGYDLDVLIGDSLISLKRIELPIKEISVAFVMTYYFFITGSRIVKEGDV